MVRVGWVMLFLSTWGTGCSNQSGSIGLGGPQVDPRATYYGPCCTRNTGSYDDIRDICTLKNGSTPKGQDYCAKNCVDLCPPLK